MIPAAISVEQTALVLAEREGRIVNLRGQEAARVSKGRRAGAIQRGRSAQPASAGGDRESGV
jgi:hypothetical protein